MPPDDRGGPTGPFSVLFVCSGDICRSPTAEALARRELARCPGVPLQVSSAAADLVLCMAVEHAREQDGDDIDDPLGRPAEAFAACAERLDGLVSTVVAALVKAMPVGTAGAT